MYHLGYYDGLHGLRRMGCSMAYVSGYRDGLRVRLP